MMAVVGLPDEPAANVSVVADWSASASVTNDFTYTVNDGRASITGYTGNDTAVVIPSTLDGLPVGEIAALAFLSRDTLTSVTLPASLTNIGDYAFASCTSLTSVTLPASLTSIGYGVFLGCTSLASITLPANLTSIETEAFSNCTNLTSITLPATLTHIGSSAFSFCTSLTSITLPATLTSIGNSAFGSCTSLTSVTLPARLTSIGDDAFHNCNGMTRIDVASVNPLFKSVGGVLYNKQGSQLIIYPGGRQGPFAVPQGVKRIGDSAFLNCTGLTRIILPAGLESIGNSAFLGCDSLTSIRLPEGLRSIGAQSFYNCRDLTSIILPASLTSVGDYAFYASPSLTRITLPASLTRLGDNAFSGCISLMRIDVASVNPLFKSVDGVLYNKQGSLLICYPGGKQGSFTVPRGVVRIGDSAFSSCTSLTSIRLPSGLKSIGNSAFFSCYMLSSIQLPASLTSIGDYAFMSCVSLTSITLPASVNTIGDAAFTGCENLRSVTFLGDAPQLEAGSTLDASSEATVYYLPKKLGWLPQFGGSPTAPITLPPAPAGLGGVRINASVSLTWAAPALSGGLPVSHYVIQYRRADSLAWSTVKRAASAATAAVVTGLTNNRALFFRVAAVNALGQGEWSVQSSEVPPLPTPTAPGRPVATTVYGGVALRFAAPEANGGLKITDYVIQYRPAASGSQWFTYNDGVTSTNTATVRRLVPGRAYVFRVAAKNLAGTGAFSSPSAVITA